MRLVWQWQEIVTVVILAVDDGGFDMLTDGWMDGRRHGG